MLNYHFIFINDVDQLTTHEKRVLRKLCVNKEFGCWVDYYGTELILCENDTDYICGWTAVDRKGNIGVYVRKALRGLGIGKKLVKYLVEQSNHQIFYATPRDEYPASIKIFNSIGDSIIIKDSIG